MSNKGMSRRSFVAGTSKAALGASLAPLVVPRHVLGAGYQAPSDTLNMAVVGMGQQGTENIEALIRTENLVAVCDVDFGFAERTVRNKRTNREGEPRETGVLLNDAFDRAARFTDFRVMLERQPDIDAVIVATPDHLHAHIAKAAMELGKHVYVQKPLTYSVHEARVLRRVAAETGVVTQMGNQGHSGDDGRRVNEWLEAGVIGTVDEVYIWTNRPIWPQGVPWPAGAEMEAVDADAGWGRGALNRRVAAGLGGSYAPPDGMDWELYQGPIAADVPYHPIYHPFNWRGWVPFGVGALGDMGAHLLDHPYWALGLTYPTSIEATSTPWGGSRRNPASYPLATAVHYEFPARGLLPPVRLHWYDGGLMPPRPAMLPDDVRLNAEGGVLYVGRRGLLMHETYGNNPRLFPDHLQAEADAVPETYRRIEGGHQENFARACKGEDEATSPFDYAAPLTETMLLGIAALRGGAGQKVLYDAERMEFTNMPDANQYLTREYRAGWTL
ncbi:MAG: Gfo/Idh/MocA family oxidoreductase [Gemmatimonadota bacterium]